MRLLIIICAFYLSAVNFFSFLLFGMDKYKARKNKWRIRERDLFLSALAGGSLGALLGMRYFHHKTRHASFVFGIPAILIIQIFLILLVCLKLW